MLEVGGTCHLHWANICPWQSGSGRVRKVTGTGSTLKASKAASVCRSKVPMIFIKQDQHMIKLYGV